MGECETKEEMENRFGKVIYLLILLFLGVYFTSLDPSHDPKSILLNNYDDRGFVINSKPLWAKIEWVVEVYIDEDEVEKIEESNRDVYLYPGDVNLTKYQWKVYQNSKM